MGKKIKGIFTQFQAKNKQVYIGILGVYLGHKNPTFLTHPVLLTDHIELCYRIRLVKTSRCTKGTTAMSRCTCVQKLGSTHLR